MKVHAFRLTRGQDLKNEIKKYSQLHKIEAGIILTAVGCVSEAVIRMAGAKVVKSWKEHLEVVSLVGTLSVEDSHLHIALSKEDGSTIGGHLKEGCLVDTTMEIMIGELPDYEFKTELDQSTGYKELKVVHKK